MTTKEIPQHIVFSFYVPMGCKREVISHSISQILNLGIEIHLASSCHGMHKSIPTKIPRTGISQSHITKLSSATLDSRLPFSTLPLQRTKLFSIRKQLNQLNSTDIQLKLAENTHRIKAISNDMQNQNSNSYAFVSDS